MLSSSHRGSALKCWLYGNTWGTRWRVDRLCLYLQTQTFHYFFEFKHHTEEREMTKEKIWRDVSEGIITSVCPGGGAVTVWKEYTCPQPWYTWTLHQSSMYDTRNIPGQTVNISLLISLIHINLHCNICTNLFFLPLFWSVFGCNHAPTWTNVWSHMIGLYQLWGL